MVGAGIFGVTAALEFRRRDYDVSLLDPGPLPHPLATSTDISKMVRMDYGDDELFTALAEESIEGWHRWNLQWGQELYHNDGFLIMTSRTMRPGTFEHDSLELMKRRGHDADSSLADAPLVGSRYCRYCRYCDTWDGNFWIDHDPEREGLVVATGGSGHGFKFAPVLGNLIADALERVPNPYASRFGWRSRGERKSEPARHLGS